MISYGRGVACLVCARGTQVCVRVIDTLIPVGYPGTFVQKNILTMNILSNLQVRLPGEIISFY